MTKLTTKVKSKPKTKALNKALVSSSKPAVAMLEIKHCKDCPFAETKKYWTEDNWEEAYDWHCKKANGQKIQGYVEWHEVKDMTIPEWCPLTK